MIFYFYFKHFNKPHVYLINFYLQTPYKYILFYIEILLIIKPKIQETNLNDYASLEKPNHL
jgi:hypothetical protein